MTLAVLVATLLAQAPVAAPVSTPPVLPPHLNARVPTGWTSLSERERAEVIAGDAGLTLPERLLRVSERFLGTPYVHSPLGEGQGVDPDPPFRLDAVDCLTFVEQTLAMSLARADTEVAGLLERLRYANAPTYEERNHLMEAQWLPNNQRKGFLLDVTRTLGGEDTVRVRKTLTAQSWKSPSSLSLGLPRERQVEGTFELDMIPLERVMTHARQVPSGSILVVLREDMPYKATRITHLGFVVQKGKRTWLRHARRGADGAGRVVDEDLESFLARNAKYDKWRVTGVSLFEVLAPAPARGAWVHSE